MPSLPARRLLLCSVLILLSCGFTASAQRRRAQMIEPYPPQLTSELIRLRDAAMVSDYAYKQLAHLCNNIGPRLSGSPQAQQAVEYIAAEMRRLGLDVKLEKVMVPHWVRGVETAELIEFKGQAPGTKQKVVVTALGGSIATPPEGITAEVIVVKSFAELRALGREKVAGKIVVYNAPFDQRLAEQGLALEAYSQTGAYRSIGASEAAKLGAVAAMNRALGGANYRLPHTGAMFYLPDTSKIPAASITAEDCEMLAYLTAQGPVKMHLTLTPQTLPDAESYNVIADVKGSEHPEQIVIVSGHLDSWDLGTGAIDDGAGVVMAMQTVQLMKQLGLKPKRTIRFIPWINEENGSRGGTTYVQDYAAEVGNHVAAIEADLGAGHPAGFFAHASPQAIDRLRPLVPILSSFGASLIKASTDAVGEDISYLEAKGVPGFAPIFDTRHYFDYHHTPADTLDKVNPRELAENAALMAVLAYAIASLPEPLPR